MRWNGLGKRAWKGLDMVPRGSLKRGFAPRAKLDRWDQTPQIGIYYEDAYCDTIRMK